MARNTISVNIDSIHDQVDTTIRELCSGAERIRLIAATLEDTVGEVLNHSPADDLRRAGAIVRIHAMSMFLTIIEVAGKAERLEAIAALQNAADPPMDSDGEVMLSK